MLFTQEVMLSTDGSRVGVIVVGTLLAAAVRDRTGAGATLPARASSCKPWWLCAIDGD